MSLSSLIVHTILKPDCTMENIRQLCEEAKTHNFAAVCVPPFFVKEAKSYLSDSSVAVATVIGFPLGYSNTPAKVEEIKRAIDEGADELDVVINLCAVKSERWNYVKNDIESTTMAAHLKGKLVKIILETSLLSNSEIQKLCEICSRVGVDFVKTSTGFNGDASVEVVAELRKLLPSNIKIKASGKISSVEEAKKFQEAGASRIGSTNGVQIVDSL